MICDTCSHSVVCENYKIGDVKVMASCLHYSPSPKHGKWLISSDGYYPYCSWCGNEPENGKMKKYCADCGVKMDL